MGQSDAKGGREITGKHVLIGFVAAFALIIGVNVLMAVQAVRTFPGLEVKNGYVASQTFNERKAAQEALGWTTSAELVGSELVLSVNGPDGHPVEVRELNATLGRPTEAKDDREPAFVFNGQAYVAPMELHDGNWDLRLVAIAQDGTVFQQRLKLHIKR